MAKLERKTQKIFGASSLSSEITAYATTLETNPTFTKDISVIQNESFERGVFAGTDNGNQRPFAEDRNGVDYTITRQLAYILQAGIPEWDGGTDYHLSDIVRVSSNLFISLQNDNVNHNPVTSPNWWRPYTLDSEDAGMVGEIKMYAGTILPSQKWQWCRGQELSKAQYPLLYSRIGDAYGVASNVSSFRLPNMYGRIPIGISMSGEMSNVGYQFGTLNHTHIQQAHKHTNLSGLAIGVAGGAHNHTITDNGHDHANTRHRHQVHYSDYHVQENKQQGVRATDIYPDGSYSSNDVDHPAYTTYSQIDIQKSSTGIVINSASHTHNAGSFTGYVGPQSAQNGDNNLNTGSANPPCITVNFIIKVTN